MCSLSTSEELIAAFCHSPFAFQPLSSLLLPFPLSACASKERASADVFLISRYMAGQREDKSGETQTTKNASCTFPRLIQLLEKVVEAVF